MIQYIYYICTYRVRNNLIMMDDWNSVGNGQTGADKQSGVNVLLNMMNIDPSMR